MNNIGENMNEFNIIGVSGRSGSGKDTLANMFSQSYKKIAFADKLKEIVMNVYDLDYSDVYDIVKKETQHPNLYGKTPREALQRLGTEGFRNLIGEYTWIDALFREVERTRQSHSYSGVIITDVRLNDEAETIKEAGGIIISIDRSLPDDPKYSHSSESYIKLIRDNYADIIIDNNGTVEDLHRHLGNMLKLYYDDDDMLTDPNIRG